MVRSFIKMLPIIGPITRKLHSVVASRRSNFTNSAEYWESRYRSGGNSGAGSCNRLAHFKADFLNRFVARHGIESVIEFGSGDGTQLELASYPSYIGVDVSQAIIEISRQKFAHDPSMNFIHTSEYQDTQADMALSLDVIYHLIEDDVFDAYMHRLFNAGREWVVIYSSNEDKPWPDPHVRHRNFTKWVEANRVDFSLVEHVPNAFPYDKNNPGDTSFSDFYVYRRA